MRRGRSSELDHRTAVAGHPDERTELGRRSILRLYRREGTATKPHDHQAVVGVIPTSSDETDGIEIISRPLPGFPDGLLVMMNSGPKNFLLYDWREIAAQITR